MPPYEGEKQWAPCVHNEAEGVKAKEWLDVILQPIDPDGPSFTPEPEVADVSGESSYLEHLMWYLGLAWWEDKLEGIRDVKFGFYADQWVGVSCEIEYTDGSTEKLWTEGDSFTLAFGKTVERLKTKVKKGGRESDG